MFTDWIGVNVGGLKEPINACVLLTEGGCKGAGFIDGLTTVLDILLLYAAGGGTLPKVVGYPTYEQISRITLIKLFENTEKWINCVSRM